MTISMSISEEALASVAVIALLWFTVKMAQLGRRELETGEQNPYVADHTFKDWRQANNPAWRLLSGCLSAGGPFLS